VEEFYARFERLCGVLLDNPGVCRYCYTRLTDVFQEQTGIRTFDRRPEFDLDRLGQVQRRPAAIEGAGGKRFGTARCWRGPFCGADAARVGEGRIAA
jgi:hypothetical protein